MPLDFSTVTDNSLLPFAGSGAVRVPTGTYSVASTWFDLTTTFENDFQWGGQSYTGLRAYTGGKIQFGNGAGWQNTYIAPANFLQDTRNTPSWAVDPGIWIENNTARDSIVITWKDVAVNPYNGGRTNTYQIELLDRGNGDTEIIYRFNDMRGSSIYDQNSAVNPVSYFMVDDARERPPLGYLGIDKADYDVAIGNTGVQGVWQFRIESGVLRSSDLVVQAQNLSGTTGADVLTGSLTDDILLGLDGDDTLIGSFGNDQLIGGAGDDDIDAGYGNDYIMGGAGNDNLRGGYGNDTIGAGAGDDTVNGSDGNDFIYGAEGANRLLGGNGSDYMTSGSGADALIGGDGNDTLNSGAGNDTLDGGAGNDTLYGGDGENLFFGGADNDLLAGGVDTDRFYGGDGNDKILAGGGDDIIFAGSGADSVSGGAGNDLIVAEGGYYASYYYDYAAHHYVYTSVQLDGMDGNDSIIGGDTAAGDTITGGAGDDQLRGRGGSDLIGGGDGNDTILGDDSNVQRFIYGQNDTLYGGAGDDQIFGGAGNDFIEGNDGNDVLRGGSDNDELYGGAGDDFLFGADGTDTLTGGAGADRFFTSFGNTGSSVITDYNAADGDTLVLAGSQFNSADLRFYGDRLFDLNGNNGSGPFGSLSLVRVDGAGSIVQTLFTFENPSQIDHLILRMPDATDPAVPTGELDLVLF